MTKTEEETELEFEQCEVRCPRCDITWVTSLHIEWCNCLACGTKLDPKKHLVVTSEQEVN